MVWKAKHSLEANLRYPSKSQTTEPSWKPLGKQTYAKPTFVLNIPTRKSKPQEEPSIPIYEVGAFPKSPYFSENFLREGESSKSYSTKMGMLITRYLQSVLTLYQTLDQYQKSDGEPIDMSFVNSVEEHMGLKREERDAFRRSCVAAVLVERQPGLASISMVAANQLVQGNASNLYRAVTAVSIEQSIARLYPNGEMKLGSIAWEEGFCGGSQAISDYQPSLKSPAKSSILEQLSNLESPLKEEMLKIIGQRDLEQGDYALEKVEETDPEENKFIKELFKMARIQNLGGIMPLGDMENYPDMADYIEHRFRELREKYPDMEGYADDFFSHMSRNDEACSENLKQRILEHMKPVHISPPEKKTLADTVKEATENFMNEYMMEGPYSKYITLLSAEKRGEEVHISVGLEGKLPKGSSLPDEYQGFKVRYVVIGKGSTDPSAALEACQRFILDEGDEVQGDSKKWIPRKK